MAQLLKPRTRGVTLMETVMGLTLTLMVMVMGINLLPYSLRAMSAGEQKVHACNLAQTLMEEQRSGDFDALITGYLPDAEVNGVTYKVHLEVEEVPPRLKRLTLRLDWSFRGRNPQFVEQKVSLCKLAR